MITTRRVFDICCPVQRNGIHVTLRHPDESRKKGESMVATDSPRRTEVRATSFGTEDLLFRDETRFARREVANLRDGRVPPRQK